MALLHGDQLRLSVEVGSNCQAAGDLGLLTNTTVAAADTNTGLQTAVTAAVVHGDILPSKARINRAISVGINELTDAAIAPLTTVAGLVALTQNSNLLRNQFLD